MSVPPIPYRACAGWTATNVLRNKPVAVIGASTGMFGAVWAQAELRKVLSRIGASVDHRELAVGSAADAFTPDLQLRDPHLARQLDISSTTSRAERHGAPPNARTATVARRARSSERPPLALRTSDPKRLPRRTRPHSRHALTSTCTPPPTLPPAAAHGTGAAHLALARCELVDPSTISRCSFDIRRLPSRPTNPSRPPPQP